MAPPDKKDPIEDIRRRFGYHPPVANGKVESHEAVREVMGDMGVYLLKTLPQSREASLAITKLEEAMFWANAAIARNP